MKIYTVLLSFLIVFTNILGISSPVFAYSPAGFHTGKLAGAGFSNLSAEFNIILGRPTDNSITMSLFSEKDVTVNIQYGTTAGKYNIKTSDIALKGNTPQSIDITGLSPNTQYYYLSTINGQQSAEHTFHTQRAAGSLFTFTIDADPHNRDPKFDGETYASVLTSALMDKPDFHINLGDTFMTEKTKPYTLDESAATFREMRPYFGLLAADAPLFLVNGNHEGELGWLLSGKDRQLPIWSTTLRQQYYPCPAPDKFFSGGTSVDPNLGSVRDGYYAWTWGDAQFIVLDPFWYTTAKPKAEDLNSNWNWTLGREQYDWLASTLQTSQAKYKFVFIHHLVGGSKDARGGIEYVQYYEWGGSNMDGSYGFDGQRAGWGKPIHQLLVENHVNAVFHGHDHVYVKQYLDGIIYQEVPQPSVRDGNFSMAAEYGYQDGQVLASPGYLRVKVTPESATVEYIQLCSGKDKKGSTCVPQVAATYSITGQ